MNLSVIIPVGRPQTAEQTIRSILGQSFLPDDVQVILAGCSLEGLAATPLAKLLVIQQLRTITLVAATFNPSVDIRSFSIIALSSLIVREAAGVSTLPKGTPVFASLGQLPDASASSYVAACPLLVAITRRIINRTHSPLTLLHCESMFIVSNYC